MSAKHESTKLSKIIFLDAEWYNTGVKHGVQSNWYEPKTKTEKKR